MIKIIQQDLVIDIPRNQWAEILLLLQEYGWDSAEQDAFYLANVSVSKQDTDGIIQAGLKIQEKALKQPFDFYPTPVDMGILAEFIELCKEGGFLIRTDN